MNVHPKSDQFIGAPVRLPGGLDAEKAIIGACLFKPEIIPSVAAKLRPDDFAEPLHGQIVAVLATLAGEGRTPSLSALKAAMGDPEIVRGWPLSRYLREALREAVVGAYAPWQDSVEVVRDAAQRRSLHTLAADLAQASVNGALAVADIAADAVSVLDDVVAAMREGKRRSYDAVGAADLALAHLMSDAPAYPTTGIEDLDRIIGGWPKGQLTLIAGRPGMAKSAVATSCVIAAAKKGYGVAFFSLEMLGEQLGARMLTDAAYTTQGQPVYYEDILRRSIKDERTMGRLRAAREMLNGLPMMIEEQRGLTLAEISARARKIQAAFDRNGQSFDVMVVDHIGLVRASNRYAGNKVAEMTELSDGLATLAKELDVAMLALSQLNRGVESRDEKRPNLSDLRESGSLEQDASLVVFPYRPAYYLEKKMDDPEADRMRQEQLDALRHVIEFGVAKNRNGRIGTTQGFIDIGANAIRRSDFHG